MWNWLSGLASKPEDEADSSFLKVFTCDSTEDNTPVMSVVGIPPEEMLFCVSQNRVVDYKPKGQDVMSTAAKGVWSCSVLCDGHDRDGLEVARGIASTLPGLVLEQLEKHSKKSKRNSGRTSITLGKPSSSKAKALDEIPELAIREAFLECEKQVCWTNEGICKDMFVKVTNGPWDGRVGYVSDELPGNKFKVVIVDEAGAHKPVVAAEDLHGAKYAGGCTCVCFVRNRVTNACRIAFVGDSRAMLIFPQQDMDENSSFEAVGTNKDDDGFPVAVATTAHNLANASEMARLSATHVNDFEVDGDFLVNPVTGFAIQPTRGFGDFDMYGTGYTSEPEMTSQFVMKPGMLLLVASDGLFDLHVWQDPEVVDFFQLKSEFETDLEEIADTLYDDTLTRSLEGGYVDDISFFMFSPTLLEADMRLLERLAATSPGAVAGVIDAVEAGADISEVANAAIIKAEKAEAKAVAAAAAAVKELAEAKAAAAAAAASAAESENESESPTKKKKKKKKKDGSTKKKKGKKKRHGTDATAATLPPAIDTTGGMSERKKSLTKQFTLTRPRDAAGNPVGESSEAPLRKGLNKSKSMSSFYFRNGRSSPSGEPMPVRQHEHTPRVGRQSNSNSVGRDSMDDGGSKRDTIRRGNQASYTDLNSAALNEFETSTQASTNSSLKSHSRSRTEGNGSVGGKSKSSSKGHSKKSSSGSSKRKSASRRSSRSSSSASYELTQQAKEAEMLQSLLSRIATKYGHELSELEGLVAEVKKK